MTAAGLDTADTASDLTRIRMRVLLVVLIVGLSVLAVGHGQTASWDLRNYHLYSPWAWLHGRAALDVIPAQVQSYFNPLLHVPIWWGTTKLHPMLFTFVLGLIQAANAIPLFIIALRLLPHSPQSGRLALAFACTVVGVTGASQMGELGSTQGDNLVSLPVLAAIAVLLRARNEEHVGGRSAAIAGILLGAATGLKPTCFPVALGVAAMVANGPLAQAGRNLLVFGAAGLVGLLATAGPWMLHLWGEYSNPVYPMLANWFDSEFAAPDDAHDARWQPSGWLQTLFYPFAWTFDWRITSELRFRDLRVPIAFALGLFVVAARRHALRDGRQWTALLVAIATTYLAWLMLFGYYRYLVVIEMLAPVVAIGLLVRAAPVWPRVDLVAWIMLALMLVSTNPPDWGVAPRYGERFLDVRWTTLSPDSDQMILIAGYAPLSSLALALPDTTSVVRVQSNFHGGLRAPFELDRRVAAAIDRHPGSLLALIESGDGGLRVDPWKRYGLKLDAGGCTRVNINLARSHEPPVLLCPVLRERPAIEGLRKIVDDWARRCEGDAESAFGAEAMRTCRQVLRLRTKLATAGQ